MPTTSTFNLPYPSLTDGPNGPAQIQALAAAADTVLAGQTPFGRKLWWLLFTGTTDASGYVTVTHGAAFTPSAVVVTPNSPITASGSASIFGMALADTFTATTVRVRCINAIGGQLASTSVTISLFLGQ